jgi:hypothetical protein
LAGSTGPRRILADSHSQDSMSCCEAVIFHPLGNSIGAYRQLDSRELKRSNSGMVIWIPSKFLN